MSDSVVKAMPTAAIVGPLVSEFGFTVLKVQPIFTSAYTVSASHMTPKECRPYQGYSYALPSLTQQASMHENGETCNSSLVRDATTSCVHLPAVHMDSVIWLAAKPPLNGASLGHRRFGSGSKPSPLSIPLAGK